jgi:hypothetical protein
MHGMRSEPWKDVRPLFIFFYRANDSWANNAGPMALMCVFLCGTHVEGLAGSSPYARPVEQWGSDPKFMPETVNFVEA